MIYFFMHVLQNGCPSVHAAMFLTISKSKQHWHSSSSPLALAYNKTKFVCKLYKFGRRKNERKTWDKKKRINTYMKEEWKTMRTDIRKKIF